MCTVLTDFWGSMAKKRKHSGNRDVLTPIANDPLASLVYLPLPKISSIPVIQPRNLKPVQDWRYYSPERPKKSLRVDGGSTRVIQKTRASKFLRSLSSPQRGSLRTKRGARLQKALRGGLSFDVPKHVVVCVRRQQRREVIFAKRLHSKGAGARRHRRNIWSEVHCK